LKIINYYEIFQTIYGWSGVLVTEFGLKRSIIAKSNADEVSNYLELENINVKHNKNKTDLFCDSINDVLIGLPLKRRIPLDFANSSPFFLSAWLSCMKIPFAETRSYSWIAFEAGSPKAFRVAGQAMAQNPYAPLVPCHRVIAKNGSLHNYSAGGIDMKAKLISAEALYNK
jgi:O-6-methylguanine DNA methyltransferase